MTVRIRERETNNKVIYRHNERPLVGIGGTIVDVHILGILKIPASLSLNSEIYGTPRFHDFELNFLAKKFVLNFDYQFRDGFYLSGTRNLPEINSSGPFIMPEIMLEGTSLNFIYIFNPEKFSYRTIITHVDRQKKGTGSFFIMTSLKYLTLADDGFLIPEGLRENFQSLPHLHKGEFTGFSLLPGYSHTFTARHFYLNLGLAVGPDLQYAEYGAEADKMYKWQLESMVVFRGGLGYDEGRFFSGIYYLNRRNNYSAGSVDIIQDSSLIRFTVGRRFRETGWMKDIRESEPFKWVNNLF